MVDEARPDPCAKVLFGDRHANTGSESLSERPCGRLDADRLFDLRMARRVTAPLAEILELVHPQREPCEVEERVEEHRAVAVRQHETVPVDPFRSVRIDHQESAPQDDGDVRHPHRHARVTRVGFLDPVHGEALDGVDSKLLK